MKQRTILERLILIVTEVKNQLDEAHPRSILALLRSRISSVISTYEEYELLDSLLLIGFLRSLFDMRFEQRVRVLSAEELTKSSIDPPLKSMIKRELRGLTVDEHFDYDYVLEFDKLEHDMTSFQQIKKVVTADDYRGIQNEIITCITRAVDKALEELQQVNANLVKVAEMELREKQTIKAFEKVIRQSVGEMHTQVFGWP